MDLSDQIIISEKKFLPLLEMFFKDKWREIKLWSHDLSHHRRVWNYAKELLPSFSADECNTVPLFTDKLLIACYLHDIGMSVDQGARHGLYSRKLTEEFLDIVQHNRSDYKDVLDAIENHDDKEYRHSTQSNLLLTCLSVADDLDAFGYIGIYRYTEIYVIRGINPSEIGYCILENAANRFNNFRRIFHSHELLLEKHRMRFEILSGFFQNYNNQVTVYNFRSSYPAGCCGVIEVLNDFIESGKCAILNSEELLNKIEDPVIINFFKELCKDLA